MAGILDRHNRHLLTEENNNQGNSFIANVNILVDNLSIINTVSEHIEPIESVFEHLSEINLLSTRIADISKVAAMKPSIEIVSNLGDNINKIVAEITTIKGVYSKLSDISFIASQFPTINRRLTLLEEVSNTLTQQQTQLADMLAKGSDSIEQLNDLVQKSVVNLGEITNALDEISDIRSYIESVKTDIEAALRDALLPIITDEVKNDVVEAAVAALADVVEGHFTGNTDFIQTYIDNYNDITQIIEGGYDTSNTGFVQTYIDTYNDATQIIEGGYSTNNTDFVGTYETTYNENN